MKVQMQTRRVFEMLEVRNLLSINPVLTQPYTPDEIRTAYGIDNITFGPAGSTIPGRWPGPDDRHHRRLGDDKYLVNTTDKTATTLYPITYANSDLLLFDEQIRRLLAISIFHGRWRRSGARGPRGKAIRPDRQETKKRDGGGVGTRHRPLANIVLIEATGGDLTTAVTEGVKAVGADVVVMSDWTTDVMDRPNHAGPAGQRLQSAGRDLRRRQRRQRDARYRAERLSERDRRGGFGFDLEQRRVQPSAPRPDTETIDSASYNSETGWSNPPAGKTRQTTTGAAAAAIRSFRPPTRPIRMGW